MRTIEQDTYVEHNTASQVFIITSSLAVIMSSVYLGKKLTTDVPSDKVAAVTLLSTIVILGGAIALSKGAS